MELKQKRENTEHLKPIQRHWWIFLGHLKWGVGGGNDTDRNERQIKMPPPRGPHPLVFRLLYSLSHTVPELLCMTNRIRQKGWWVVLEIKL